jgi:hypothetical protein
MKESDFRIKQFGHSDKRRILQEWFSDKDISIHNLKTLVARFNCTLGNHYSTKATEYFFLAYGKCDWLKLTNVKTGDKLVIKNIWKGDAFIILPFIAHTFRLRKGAVLIEGMTKVYNKDEEVAYETG